MSTLYYVGVGVLSLAETIYNFEMFAEGKNITCYECKAMTQEEMEQYKIKLGTDDLLRCTGADKKDLPGIYNLLVEQTDVYKIMALVIAIMSLLLVVLAIYLACVINALSNQTPEDFLKIGKCKRVFACLCKIFPPVILVISWINFVLIVVFWILYVIKHCEEAIDKSPSGSLDYKQYRKKHIPLLIVDSVIWICLHCGGSIIREMTYIEPFYYNPAVGDAGCFKTFILKKFGP